MFGKFRQLADILDLFQRICEVEHEGLTNVDIQKFVVYKDDERTMELQNVDTAPVVDMTAKPAGNHHSMIKSLNQEAFAVRQRDGQNFALISISATASKVPHHPSSLDIHTYQCFPTAPSALRFARKMNSVVAPVLKCRLFVVPLMIWIGLEELDDYDIKNKLIDEQLQRKHNKRYQSHGLVED